MSAIDLESNEFVISSGPTAPLIGAYVVDQAGSNAEFIIRSKKEIPAKDGHCKCIAISVLITSVMVTKHRRQALVIQGDAFILREGASEGRKPKLKEIGLILIRYDTQKRSGVLRFDECLPE